MAPDPRRASVPDHIAAVARRTDADAHRLTRPFVARCWPRGSDGHRPAAADWLVRWGPAPTGAALRLCGCRTGRCAVCN
jgi:hypothetical protein